MLTIKNVTCEYRCQVLGTDTRTPYFSWQIESDKKQTKQRSYQFKVALDPACKQVVWDTGVITSDQSQHLLYQGEPLRSCTRYYYQVRIEDTYGRLSEWSEVDWWETAFLETPLPEAKWIAPKDQCEKSKVFTLQKKVKITKKIDSARAYITALGLYELRINGLKVGDQLLTPGWTSYHHRLQYQTYDISTLLRVGENVITIYLAEGWYKGMGFEEPYEYGQDLAALLEMHITFEQGSEEIIKTDATWKEGLGPFKTATIYNGEIYDARIHEEESIWKDIQCLEEPKINLVAQVNEPVRVTQRLKPVAILQTPKGETVLDMGQNMVGRIKMTVSAAKGTEIFLSYAEVLDKEGNFYRKNLREAKQHAVYITQGQKNETYAPTFTFYGFRYVKVEGFPKDQLGVESFTGEVIHSDMKPTGTLETDNPLVNQLYQNVIWGQRGNFVDIPTDCPQRNERLGWTGDAQVFIETALYNYEGALFFKKWLTDLKLEQSKDGSVPFVIPNILPEKTFGSGWSDAATVIPWALYQMYGDKKLLENQYHSMKAWVEKVRSLATNGSLWEAKIQFGDWLSLDGDPNLPLGATPIPIIATAYHARSTKILAKAAKVLGYEEEAQSYNDLAQQIVADFQAEFVTPNGNIIGGTQTSYILPLAFDLLTADMAKKAASELHRMIVANDYHLTTGFLGTPHLCSVLSEHGYHETAMRLLLQEEYPSWLYQVKQGATTIWERWNSLNPDGTFNDSGMTSFNHYAYGSIAQWLYSTLAGISYDEKEPGFKKAIIAPKIWDLGIHQVKSTYETLYGQISSEWCLNKDEVTVKVQIPVNTEATVKLPSFATNVTLDHQPVTKKVFCLGSGEYKLNFLTGNIFQHKFTDANVVGELKYFPEAKSLLMSQLTSFVNGQMPPHIAYEMIKGLTFKECKVSPEIGLTPQEIDELLIKINQLC